MSGDARNYPAEDHEHLARIRRDRERLARERRSQHELPDQHNQPGHEDSEWEADFAHMQSAYRYVEEFSRNPFGGSRMKENIPQASATDEATAVGNGNGNGNTASDGIAMSSANYTVSEPELERGTADLEPIAASGAETVIETITPQNAAFKLNPRAKPFVPNPNLVVTPWGIMSKVAPAYLQERAGGYGYNPAMNPVMNEGHRILYGHRMDEPRHEVTNEGRRVLDENYYMDDTCREENDGPMASEGDNSA
ncbi:hypothetical protein TruAng_002435 [Truncatella angustata]|nr:hypothetical protein TruAng_002435 [Truncatella angustata]